MNTLILNKLTLKNFKGIKDFTLEPGGKSISISGINASGKTTLIDGFTYLLFGKDSKGKADFQIKPVKVSGDEIHNLETEVEGVLMFTGEYNDEISATVKPQKSKIITLKKRYYEKYTKKRGEAKKSFTGHITDYWIDGVPVKKREYETKVADIIDINAFKLVTNPLEFNELHWTGRRQILIEMCGDITDYDVIIDSDEIDLKPLEKILGDYSIDDYKKIIKEKKKGINKELEQIPIRITENQENIKNAPEPDIKDKKNLDKNLAEKQEELRALKSNEALSKKRNRLVELKGELQEIKNKDVEKKVTARKPLRDAVDLLEDERRSAMNKIKVCQEEIEKDENRNKISIDAADKLRKKWYLLNDSVLKEDNICPACGQDLPEDQIEETRKTFNKLKADKLEKINSDGLDIKKNIKQREKSIEVAKEKIYEHEKFIDDILKSLETKKEDLEALNVVEIDSSLLHKEKDLLETEIAALKNGSSTQEETAKRHIDEIDEKIAQWNYDQAAFEAVEKSRERIKDLEKNETLLNAEFEDLEAELFLIEKFIIKKVGMIEGQINKEFKLAKFKLFKDQINGGVEECCETIYKGVPFNLSLNNAAKINVGLDIISTLSRYYEFQAPIWIDNAESINKIIPTKTQVISLFVSDHKKLIIT